jgi:hypothetical protein
MAELSQQAGSRVITSAQTKLHLSAHPCSPAASGFFLTVRLRAEAALFGAVKTPLSTVSPVREIV